MTEEQAFFGHLCALQRTDHSDLDACALELARRTELRVRLVGLADAAEQLQCRTTVVEQQTEDRAVDWRPIVTAVTELRDTRGALVEMLERLKLLEGEREHFGDVLKDMHHQFKKWNHFQDAMGKAAKADHLNHDHITDHLGGRR